MSIKIDWQKFPPKKEMGEEEETRYFPRIRGGRTISDDELFARMSLHSGKHRSYYMPALEDLSQAIAETLLEGNMVKLFDLGTFNLSLDTNNEVTVNNFSDMNNIHINGVKFTPSENLLQRLQHPEFKWVPKRSNYTQPDEEQIMKYLANWFTIHDCITRLEFEKLFELSRTTATTRLNQLIEKGILKKSGSNRNTIYVPT